jgi:hypothetical protein
VRDGLGVPQLDLGEPRSVVESAGQRLGLLAHQAEPIGLTNDRLRGP